MEQSIATCAKIVGNLVTDGVKTISARNIVAEQVLAGIKAGLDTETVMKEQQKELKIKDA